VKRDLRDLLCVGVVRAAMSAIVLWGGFRAVSDDDFARIVHAQEFALNPALDPTGTSWLPFPFWFGGSAMMLFGTSITVARGVALVLGIASSLLLYAAARLLVKNRDGALIGALLATVFPWAARLGVATVPELPAAALSVFALATLAHERPGHRMWGALALLVATLCRYEPWLVAGVFAAFSLYDASRSRGDRVRFASAAALAVLGPALWLIHNAMTHGDVLHFLARVSAYKRAVGGASGVWALIGYPLSLVREEPELVIVAAVLVNHGRGIPKSFRRPVVGLGVMLALLSVAAIPGGAPTHHGGRAVLAIWLVLAIGVGEGARRALASDLRWRFALFVIALMPLGAGILRPWYARLDSFITRADEVAIGASVSGHLDERRALVEAQDYGFFAIQAGSGAPPRVLLDRNVDPRRAQRPSSFSSEAAIRDRAAELGANIVIGHVTPVTQRLGAPVATAGPWGAWVLARPSRN
jgi:hypothetical protein